MKRQNRTVCCVIILFLLLLPLTFFVPVTMAAERMQGNPFADQDVPDELRAMDIKQQFIPSQTEPVGNVQTVQGNLVVIHGGTDQAFFAASGDRVYKNDILLTLKASRCRVTFDTADLITMGQNTRIDIDEVIDDRANERKSSVLNMLRGKAMFYVVRLFRYKKTTARVKTPTAICGVRGTKFGVEVLTDVDLQARGRLLYVADASDSNVRALLAQAPPAGVRTIVHGFDGNVDVTATVDLTTKTVGSGQSLEVRADGIGDVYQTPPGQAQTFSSDTQVGPDEGTGDGGDSGNGGDEGGEGGIGSGDEGGGTDDTEGTDGEPDEPDVVTTPTSTEPLQAPEPTPTPVTVPTTTTQEIRGYFSGMLTDRFSTPYLDNVYISKTGQDFNASVMRADGLYNNEGFLDGIPGGGIDGANYVKQVAVANDPALTSADNLGLPVTTNQMGEDHYMAWGKWHVPDTFIINNIVHDLWSTGYYVGGYPTPDANIAGISGTYSGDAWGTYWNGNSGIDMTGWFMCNVNGAIGTVTNFELDVTGGGKSAYISGASGTLSGSSFVINTGTGTWDLNATAPAYRRCSGSLYGPNGEGIGGVWGMKADSMNGAQGIFVGTPSSPP